MLRIAILGVGWAGMHHVEAIRELGRNVTVHCLVDSDADHLRTKAEELGIQRTYKDVSDALSDPEVDAVSICLPHSLHCEVALAAAQAGKHILVEKPMALTVEEATRMIEVTEAAGVKLYVAENASYSPMSAFLREIVRSGSYIGEVVAASVVKGFRGVPYGYHGRRAWLSTPEMGGTGAWMLQGIHSVAQLRFVLGEVETVYMGEYHARSFTPTGLEGTMSGLLTMERGFRVALLQTCEVRLKGKLGGYVLHGDRGSIWASEDECEVSSEELGERPVRLNYPKAALSPYALEMDAFANYVTCGIEGPTTGRSERKSLAVVQAGYESVHSGQPVNLKARFGDLS